MVQFKDVPLPAAVTGLVLAGGRSARFGSDKSRFTLGGAEMRVRIGWIMRKVAPHVLLSAAYDTDLTAARDNTATAEHEWPFEGVVTDRYPNRGPLSGIHAGLSSAAAGFLLVAPCDMPDVTAATLRRLIATMQDSAAAAVVAEDHAGLIPVLGCYRTHLVDEAENVLRSQTAGTSVEAFVRSLPEWRAVRLNESEARNINRPEDAR